MLLHMSIIKRKSIVKGKYSLRELIAKQVYPEEVVNIVSSLLKDLNIRVVGDHFSYEEYVQIMWKYRLLPGDARIVLTCKHYGILTFDEDFE